MTLSPSALEAAHAAFRDPKNRGEPDAWQWRYRDWAGSYDQEAYERKWSEWFDGRIPNSRPIHEDREERPLYATSSPEHLATAIRAYLEAGQTLIVEPLEWRDMTYKGVEEWLAHTPFDSYTVKFERQYELPFVRRPYGAGPSNFATADEAKAACETDYETGIRSALTTPILPSAVMEKRDMNDAAEIANKMQRVCQGEPTASVYVALSLMIGAAAAQAKRPDFDACMDLVRKTALHEFNRRLKVQP